MQSVDKDMLGKVAVYRASEGRYPTSLPYNPSQRYPEYPFAGVSTEPNFSYEAVRGALHLAGLDRANFDTPTWNPLAEIISEGDAVVIKPNMVRDFHEGVERGTEALITHSSVLRAVIDYVYLALNRKGKVVIADSPQNDADWDGLWQAFEFDALLDYYKSAAAGFEIEIRDLRKEAVVSPHGVVVKRYKRPGDPLGYSQVNLGQQSEFDAVPERFGKFYGSEYDVSETNTHHQAGRHEYGVANTFLNADVVINVPKLKTHKKSGITAWLKSVIGICGDKNWLPHHTRGTPSEGGDQFAEDGIKRKTERRLMAGVRTLVNLTGPAGAFIGGMAREVGAQVFGDTNANAIRSGNWHGNDTIWRTVLDLHKVWIYGDKQGRLCQTPQRKFICIIDGIVAGEGNGPLAPDPKPAGLCIVGFDPIATDTTCAMIMGFDPERLPILSQAHHARGFHLELVPPEDITVESNVESWNGPVMGLSEPLRFKPHFGWKGFIER
ncbi:MAG TPA: DUF362 domain-containing protein [Blastocatellia bacterium]